MAAQDLLMSHAVELPSSELPIIKEEKIEPEVKTEAPDFADNECAMALLCLATASVPMMPKEEVKVEEEEEKWSADPEGYCILKRQLRLHIQQESEAVKRIRLDHNYAWSGHAGLKAGYKGDGSLYEREGFLSGLGYCPSDAKKTKRRSRSPKAKRTSPKGKSSSPKDVYEPNDSKYNNFNLLLKCLTKDEEKSEGECEDSLEHQCNACPKVFSKKRYLTKHQLRMHQEPSQVACPTCGDLITKTTLSQHAEMCAIGSDSSDLADCQFCGIRMRRHILEKHLALEHCQADDDLSDSSTLSGSEHDRDDVAMATSPRRPLRNIVPNEAGFDFNLVQRNTVSCQLCGQRVSRMQLTEHLSSVHSVDKQKSQCKHSMLQRFLNDDQKTEECESCVSRLNNNYRAANSSGNSDCRSSERSVSPKEFAPNDYTLLVKKESVAPFAIPYSAKLVNGESI